LHIKKNLSVSFTSPEILYLKPENTLEMENPFVFQNLKTENNLSVILQIGQPWNIGLILWITLSLIWGSAMKILVYIECTKHKILKKPINLLILIDQVSISPTFYGRMYFDFPFCVKSVTHVVENL
jgi:hypothetical protein